MSVCSVDEESAIKERLVLKSAALDRLARRYTAFVSVLEADGSTTETSNDDVGEKELAELEAELDDFERASVLVSATEQSQQNDIETARFACQNIEQRIKATSENLRTLQEQLAHEQAATLKKKDVEQLAYQVSKLSPVQNAMAQISELQKELEQTRKQCAKVEQKLRLQRQQLEPLEEAAQKVVSFLEEVSPKSERRNHSSKSTR